ncbi:iron-containing alcohol dehydrogenase [Wenxinia marina]|uniref:Alcohol dehydrogenase, class IV n=1 Tax=Wenxinia marina DSM 24838 TaxID=1123501 RepID=A0A0D0QCT2_9RHOB|nr:iron-containing alcohol dehydrogenase [Wenxinia marina]KIQ70127.1 Alcohol dehydrogenase, class IV [Wenxinia marina DSM 24838]GGL80832.1 maleylacetate reductase [Wenxinia marina]
MTLFNTPAPMGEADIPAATRVVYGPGTLHDAIPAEVEVLGASRVFLVTGRTLGGNAQVARLKDLLGDRLAGHFAEMGEHSPRSTVLAAAAAAAAAEADCLIGIGGGSAIIGTKGVALILGEGEDLDALRAHYDYRTRKITVPRLANRKPPVIAVPTTLTSGEFSSAMGITDDATGSKDIFIDPGVVPRVIVLDPVLAAETPHRLWASTGVKALQNAIERFYARNANPFIEGTCLEAIAIVFRDLAPSLADPQDIAARGRLQFLNWMTAFGAGKGGIGLGHGICHQLGAVSHVPHGISGGIVLPHMMRFNRPETLDRQRRIAAAMGIRFAASDTDASEQAEARVRALVTDLGLPTTLSDAGVRHEDLPRVAELTLRDRTLAPTPRPPRDAAEVLGLLEEMF